MFKFPVLSLHSVIVVFFLIVIALGVVSLSYWRHFHHFTYAVVFLLVALLFFLIYQVYDTETVAILIYIVLTSGVAVFLIDIHDFLLLFKGLENKIKYCKHFSACPCGCGHGICRHSGSEMIDGNELAGDCPHYEFIENAHKKVNI